MKKLIILLTVLMVSGCATYQYNPNLTPMQNAQMELEYHRIRADNLANIRAARQYNRKSGHIQFHPIRPGNIK